MVVVEGAHLVGGDVCRVHAGVACVADLGVAVFVGGESAGGGFDSHGEVFADDGDVVAGVAEVFCDAEDAGVVVAEAEAFGEDFAVDVV